MTRLPVNPTRMELSRLKKQLELSVRGHKLLKDKQDEMIRRFVAMVAECTALRGQAETELRAVRTETLCAKAPYPDEAILLGSLRETAPVRGSVELVNIMGIHIPEMHMEAAEPEPSGFGVFTPALAAAKMRMQALLPVLLKLARAEKTLVMLSAEIEKIRRRVNALEYMTIPQLRETIRFIKMRLEDAERERITRLIKMEDMSADLRF